MSSWGSGIKVYAKPKKAPVKYYDISNTNEISQTFLELLTAFIYSRRLNETCIIYDPNEFISATMKYNPQLKLISTLPEEANQIQLAAMSSIVGALKFPEIQKYAADIFQYVPAFNQSILQVLQKASIKTTFDIAIHLEADASGVILPFYETTIKEYQKKTKKSNLNIYLMAESVEIVALFQKTADPSWKITSLSKFLVTDVSSAIYKQLAEVQIFAISSAVVLNFEHYIDRFIYVMQRGAKGYEFFKELNGKGFSLV